MIMPQKVHTQKKRDARFCRAKIFDYKSSFAMELTLESLNCYEITEN